MSGPVFNPSPKRLAFFERYLSLWVFLCMVAGVALGSLLPDVTAALSQMQFGRGSQVNIPIGVLLWLMIYPMMLKVDFSAIGGIARKPKGLVVTLFINWLVKPFSMAFLAWLFMQHIFAAWIDPETARNYTAGLIILAAAPCTAMVFVWSYLTDGKPTKAVFDMFKSGKMFAYVITVCDEASAERCPIFPGITKRLHWSFPDPSAIQGTHEEKLARTCEIRDQIKAKIEAWCSEVCQQVMS